MEELKKKDFEVKGNNYIKILFRFLLRIIITVILLYIIISLVEWDNLFNAYKTADTNYILLSLILLIANLGIRTIKWRIILQSVKNNPSIRESFSSLILGISLGSFTPVEIGEYAGRVLHINDVRRSHLIGLTLLDKAQIFLSTMIFGIISILIIMIDNIVINLIFICLLFSLFIFISLRMNVLAEIGHKLNATFLNKNWLRGILDGFNMLKQESIKWTIICTVFFHFVLVLQMYFLLNAFQNISIVNAFLGTSAMMFVKSLLPISFGDLGIREISSIYFFAYFNISNVSALNASLLLFFINVFIPSVIGIALPRKNKLSSYFSLLSFENNINSQSK